MSPFIRFKMERADSAESARQVSRVRFLTANISFFNGSILGF
jgi:hypothetical protein